MLKIDRIDDENIRIQQGEFNLTVAPVFFASAGDGGMITISPISTGAFRSFSDTLENVEINGVNGSEYAPEEAAHELNSFVGNFLRGGSSSSNNGNENNGNENENTDNVWIRPADRPAIPVFAENEQSVYWLFGVQEFGLNDYAFQLEMSAGGTYEVDWGDGTVESHISSDKPEHSFDFASIDVPVGSEGYKWVWIKATATNGNFNILDFDTVAPTWRTNSIFVSQVFEIICKKSDK